MELGAAKPGFKSGFVALLGKPNVGKSTLLNRLVGTKVAIVSEKPQTTRHRIVGVLTTKGAQLIFLDTPGIHSPKHALGEYMVEAATEAAKEADVVGMVVDGSAPPDADDLRVARVVKAVRKPSVLIVNKVDLLREEEIPPRMEEYSALADFDREIDVSALVGHHIEELKKILIDFLPEGPPLYPTDQKADVDENLMIEEIIREKILERTYQEVPHSVAVVVEERRPGADGKTEYISATIFVEKPGQKGIIIGKGGKMLKSIGTAARKDIEELLGKPVYLELWVKVREKWRKDESWLQQFGYFVRRRRRKRE